MKKSFALLMAAIVLISMAAGAAYAKYVTQKPLGGTVSITAKLGTIELKEHLAKRQADGSYELGSEEVDKNTYTLLPGMDVPKDPFVRITNKTPIACYVYVEIVSKLNGSAVAFAVDVYDQVDNPDGKWIELSGVIGENGGKVYVYGGKDGAMQVTNGIEAKILKNDEVTIGQKLNSMQKTDLGITFYAYMYQVASGNDATQVFENNK